MNTGVYLNNAATSWPKPQCVAQAVAQAVSARPGSANRGGIDDFDVFAAVRGELALLMGANDADKIALGANATWGLNLAVQGFNLEPGDTVVTSAAEHNSVLRPLHKLAGRGVRTAYVPTDRYGRIDPAAWREAVEKLRPRLCVFTHASNVTGAVNDARYLASCAKDAGAAVLLDASQTLGCVAVRCADWGIDMLAFTGHKYLLGPQGTGGLYVSDKIRLSPLLCGGTGIKSDLDEMPPEMPIHLEAGTGNEPSFYGLYAALRWSRENPADPGRTEELTRILAEGLMSAGADVISPPGERTPVVSFTVPGKTADDAGYILSECCDITCRSGLHCAPKIFAHLGVPATVRFSLSRFTSMEDVREAVAAVRDIVGGN